MIGQPRGGDFEPPLPPFLGEPVGHFIQGGTAEVAGAKHPATQCQNQNSQLRTNPVKSGASISAQPSGQFPSNSRKSGPVLTAPCGYERTLKQYLINGFRFGFRTNFIGEISSFEAPNLKSALQNPEILFSKLSKELDARRIPGPFDTAPFPLFRTSPVGIVHKKVPND